MPQLKEHKKTWNFIQKYLELLWPVIRGDIQIATGDLNAKVGIKNEGLEHVMGRHKITENGKMFCASQGLNIGGILFIRKEIHKNTSVSLDLRTENQIAINRSFRRSLLNV
jgi:hypothetical protein